jgi:hypothetical protein
MEDTSMTIQVENGKNLLLLRRSNIKSIEIVNFKYGELNSHINIHMDNGLCVRQEIPYYSFKGDKEAWNNFCRDYALSFFDHVHEQADPIKDEKRAKFKRIEKILLRPIGDLEFNKHVRYCLEDAGILIVKQLVVRKENEVRSIPKLGKKSFNNIESVLAEQGLALGMKL